MNEKKNKVTTDGRDIIDYLLKKYRGFRESMRTGKELADMNLAESLFKRAIGYIYQQVAPEFISLPTTKVDSEKVTNMVGTFLNEDSTRSLFRRAIGYSYLQIVSESAQVPATKVNPEKVDATVTTFLNEEGKGSLFRGTIDYIYQQAVLESLQLPAN